MKNVSVVRCNEISFRCVSRPVQPMTTSSDLHFRFVIAPVKPAPSRQLKSATMKGPTVSNLESQNVDSADPLRGKVLKAHPLARWMEQLTVVRNACAHHSRVWNRPFTPVSTAGLRTIEELHSLPEGQSERLYGAFAVMAHMLQSTSPGSTWAGKVGLLIENSFSPLLGRSVAEMGFPIDWRNHRLWSP